MPGKDRKRRQLVDLSIVCIAAVLIFTADFFVKQYFLKNPHLQSIPVIKNILYISVVFNSGAAFGILKGKTTFLVYVGLIFLLLFLMNFIKEEKKNRVFLIACGLIAGGALSNLYDRIFIGYVVDYIDLRVWPVFNISDSAITVGAFLLFLNEFKKPAAFKP
ncbi:MAG: signal peptidase II [Candidatus Omnitrophota bacterium]